MVPPNRMKLWRKEPSLGPGGEDGEFPVGHLEGEGPADDVAAVNAQHLFPGQKYRLGCH